MCRLSGVVEHQGSMAGGHYIAYVSGKDGVWYRVSDDHVSQCDADRALGANAFLLFYAKNT